MTTTTNVNDLLWQKIEHVRFGMLTTTAEGHGLTSRPMTNQKIDKDGYLWFFTSDQASVAHQIQAHPLVNVSFSAPDDSLYVSVSGTASLVMDKDLIESMWNPMVGAWFPHGPSDPHVALIKVAVTAAEYWDSDKSKMMQLFAMAKAALAGELPTDIGTHEKLKI